MPRVLPPAKNLSQSREPDVLTVEEAAKLLRIGRAAAYAAVERKEIPSARFGRKIRIPMAALRKLLDSPAALSQR